MEASFRHGKLIVPGGGITAYLDKSFQEVLCLGKFPGSNSNVRKLKKCIGKVGIGFKCLLEEVLCFGCVALAFGDVTQVEKASGIVRIEFEPVLKVLLCLIEPAEVAVGEPQEGVGASRLIDFKKPLEDLDRLLDLSRHEVTLAEGGHEVGAIGGNLQT